MYRSAKYWRINLGKVSIPFWAILTFIVVLFLLPFFIAGIILELQPIQTAHVTVVSKRTKDKYVRSGGGHSYIKSSAPYIFVTFQFADGSEKEFNVNPRGSGSKSKYEFFDGLQEGDTGILSYKQVKDGTKIGQQLFISFEKDP